MAFEMMVKQFTDEASQGINQEMGLSPNYDQTRGNQCHLLTLSVMNRLRIGGVEVSRELHEDDYGNWHYLLAHRPPEAEPTDEDLLSDLNPWQWGGNGRGILHLSRHDLMQYLRKKDAPEYVVALRSMTTIIESHDDRLNPYGR